MTTAEHGKTIQIHYTGRLADGTVFDSSDGRDPLEFELGAARVIPGLDLRMRGVAVGEKRTFEIPCDEAYGQHNPDGVQTVSKDQLPADTEPTVGMQLQASAPGGQTVVFFITDVGADSITVDANHPLAGKDLIFDIELLSVR